MKYSRLIVLTFAFLSAFISFGQAELALQPLYDAGEFAQVIAEGEKQTSKTASEWVLMGDSHQKLQQFDEAMLAYDEAKKLGAIDEALLKTSICHFGMGEFSTAEKHVQKYLGKHSSDEVALYYLAAIRFVTYDIKDALEICNEILELDANDMEAYYLRASCFVELKKYEKARRDYVKVLEINPDYLRAKLNLAIVDIETNQYALAVETLEALVFQQIDFYGEAFYYLAEARYALHNKEGACEAWQESADWGDKDAKRSYNSICLEGGKKPKRKVGSAAF